MARVPRRATSAQAPLARSRAAKAKTRKHKIVMESVTQAKKKLRSVISFEAKAPPGYTKEGHKVFAVSTTPHQRMHNLSQQVHRIGYHFPSVVVAASCMELGVFLSTMGKVMTYQEAHPHGGSSNFDRKMRADSEVSQTTINTEARDAIKDLFPNIPDKDLNQIIKTAFQKGQRKVGTASELPLARRAQLAVVAHIRHVYTQYDRLLRVTSFQEARASVEEPTLAKLVQWRGDDENGKTVLEDVFREVIVISDDEDDDSVIEEDINAAGGYRDSSIEVVSSNALVGELDMLPLNYSNLEHTNSNAARDLSGDEAPTGFRFVPGTHRRDPTRKKNPDRRGFNRYQAWDRARDRYRDGGYVAEYGSIPRHAIDDPVSRAAPGSRLESSRPRPDHMEGMHRNLVNSPNDLPTRPMDTRHEPRGQLERLRHDKPIQANSHNSHPTISRQTEPVGAPDRVFFAPVPRPAFERIPAPGPSDPRYIPMPRDAPPTRNPPSQVRSHATATRAYHSVDYPDEHRVYPSIETPQSPPRRVAVNRPDERNYHTTSDDYRRQPQTPPPRPIDDLSRQVKIIGIDDGQRDQSLYKRRRVEYNSPLRGDIPASSRVNEVRPVAQTPEKPREPQYISLISPASVRGSDRIQPRFGDERSSLQQEFTPAGRQLENHPVGRAPSLIPVPHNTGFSGSFDRQSGHNYRAPVSLHHSRHDSDASLNSFKPPPAPVSYRESGYMVRDDGHAVRSNQISNLAEPRSQFADHAVRQVSEVPMVPRDQQFREGPQPLVMKENVPVRHHYISNQGLQMEGERPREFARPVHLRGREAAPHHDMPRFLPQERQPGDIPFQRAERDPHAGQASYREPNRLVPEAHLHRYPSSPKHAYPQTQVPVSGQHRLIRIDPGSTSQDTGGFMIHSPASAVPRDGRGRVSLDNGRYAYRTNCF
ncbi:hypothetical protein FQN54_002194 [Arachnomyces sp. PD_36]|nr:hypothetical protein FQN54_002194 [Arachnomyces sp. PD_36]